MKVYQGKIFNIIIIFAYKSKICNKIKNLYKIKNILIVILTFLW